MKKIKIIVCIGLCLCLCACGQSEFMDLSGFVSGYNDYVGSEVLSITDFTYDGSGGTAEYTALPYGEDAPLLLSLRNDATGKAERVRIFLAKADSEGKTVDVTEDSALKFFALLQGTVFSFCHYSRDEASLLMAELFDGGRDTLKKTGELTKTADGYHFVFYSTEVSCEVIITNTHLRPVATTEKPQSRPYFADDDVTRDTLPKP